MRIDWRTISAATAAAAGLLLPGCGGESQETSKASGTDASWKVESTPSPGKEGAAPRPMAASSTPTSTELPASFPEDVPQYPGAKIKGVRASAGEGLSVSFVSRDDVDKVASFYADTFAARGWATDIRRTPDGQAIFADKGDRTASAIVRSGDGGEGTLVDLIVVVR